MQGLASRRARAARPSRVAIVRRAEDEQVVAVTLVVADLVAASAAWSARLGMVACAVEPELLDEPGLARGFDLGPCRLLLLEPADDSAAGDFLREHGPGFYAIVLRDGRRLSPDPVTPFDLLAPLSPGLGGRSPN
jgi:hypothetical protein